MHCVTCTQSTIKVREKKNALNEREWRKNIDLVTHIKCNQYIAYTLNVAFMMAFRDFITCARSAIRKTNEYKLNAGYNVFIEISMTK